MSNTTQHNYHHHQQQQQLNNTMSSSSSNSRNENPQLRKDTVWNRWVIFSPARSKRPSDFKSKSQSNPNPTPTTTTNCPFCIGNEHQCAPEIFRVPPDNPNWNIRVIQNLYPALSRDLDNPVQEVVPSSGLVLDGFGFHDVVIETPVHSVQLTDLSRHQIGEVFVAFTNRIQQLLNRHSIKYVQVHSQI